MVEIKSVRCICCSYFFLSQVIFGLLLLLVMLMYANEVETIRKIKITLGKKKLTTTFTFNKVKSLICTIQRELLNVLANKASKLN